MSYEADRAYKENEATEAMIRMRDRTETPPKPLTATISLAEWLTVKTAYNTLRLALCDIEGGMPTTLQEARDIATVAIGKTPRTI